MEDKAAVSEQSLKRSRLKGSERREQIIHSATAVFSRYGFRGTTMRQLADEAGISEAAIYCHFPSKEALYEAILEKRLKSRRHVYFPQDLAAAKNDRALLETIVGNFIKDQLTDSTFMRMLLFSALEGHDLARKVVEKPLQEFFTFIASYLESRGQDGAMNLVNSEIAARLLIGMPHYLVMLNEIYKDPGLADADIDQACKLIVDLFCFGIKRDRVESNQ